MIKGIGVDLIQIKRFQRALMKPTGDKLARRILTESEYQQFLLHHKPVDFLSKRFAAKEAVAKALQTGIGKISFQDIEVSNMYHGAPVVNLKGQAIKLQKKLNINKLHLTLSDEKDYAMAFVVLES